MKASSNKTKRPGIPKSSAASHKRPLESARHIKEKLHQNQSSAPTTTPLQTDRNGGHTRTLTESLLALEPRVMFDAAALLTGAEVSQETDPTQQPDVELTEAQQEQAQAAKEQNESIWDVVDSFGLPAERREMVFIDTAVEDYQTLMAGITPNAEVILLDSTRDGIEQIAEILQDRTDIEAIHIVSHGDQGELQLGTGRLTLDSMQGEYADELSLISQALSDDADFLIYGCNFGEGQIGQTAASRLAELTGADVAASSDLTGNTELGGDWDLEVNIGEIETVVAFSSHVQQVWSGVLADGDTTVTFQEGVDGYANTEDTALEEDTPTTSYGSQTTLEVDLSNSGGGQEQTLIRFDNVFGSGDGQIPLGSTIISASLTLDQTDTTGSTATVSLHRMLATWSESSTWNSMTGGISTDNVEASSTADATIYNPETVETKVITGLESTLQAWSDGATNYGWVIISDHTDGVIFSSSENGTTSLRPKLTVEYRTSGGDTTTGLEGHWNFDADANDSSGNSYNGTLTGDASIDTTDLTDKVGAGKLSLDGTGDYVDLGSHISGFSGLTEGTIAGWVKVTDSGENILFGLSDKDDSMSLAKFGIEAGGQLKWLTGEGGSTDVLAYSDQTINDGTWHHIALTVDSSGNTLYIDGEVASVTYSNGSASSTNFFDDINDIDAMDIGRSMRLGAAEGEFNGLADDVRVYNTALSVADIAALAAEAPVATNDTATTNKSTAVGIDLTANDTDLDSETITVLDVGNPSNGSVVNNEDGTVTYTPTGSFTGTDTFTYLTADLDDTISYWRLDGNGTDAVASNDGTLTGTTTVDGHYGDALSFDEVDDKVVVSDFAINNEFSLSFKIKVDDNTGSLFQYIYSHDDINNSNSLNIFLNEASHGTDPNVLRTVIRDTNDTLDNSALEFDVSHIIGDGQWHTYTLTVAAGDGSKVYLDGVLQNSDSRGGDSFNPTTDIYFGAREDLDADRFYGGSLDSVQLFNRALSPEEVNDTHTGGSSLGTATVTVVDPPVITNLASDNLAYTEGDGAVVIDQGTAATVTDSDSSDFDTGTLTVSFTAGSDSAEDVLSIRDQGTGSGQIGVSGSDVTYEGTVIGTFTGGSSGTDLVITLDSDATATATTTLLQNITYENTDTDNPTTGSRTVRYVLTDGDGGTSANYDATVTISAQNDTASVTNLSVDTLAYTEGDGAIIIEQGDDVVVSDVDSSDFDTGSLTVAFTAGSDSAEDELAIRNQGTGAGQIGVSGSNVTYAGTTIGTFTGGTGGSNLVITFNSNADATATTALIKNITYENTDIDNPTTGSRSVRFTLNDGDGGATIRTTTVNFTAVNDGPVNTMPSNEFTALDTAVVFSTGNSNLISISDVDAGSSDLEVTLSITNGTLTLAGTTGLSFTVGNGTADTTMTFTGTVSAINTALDGLSFDPTTSFRGLAQLTLATDDQGNTGSGGAQTDTDTVDIHVGAIVVTNTTDTSNGTVTTKDALVTNDGGDGISLREAIEVANAEAGTDYIYFEISDALVSGAHTIAVGTGGLDAITETVIIDGTTEPDWVAGAPVIELDGSSAGVGVDGLMLSGSSSDGSTITGLVINQFTDDGIEITNSDNNTVTGNFIGTDAAGTADLGNTGHGVRIESGASSNTIGGTTAATRNIIAGNDLDGVYIHGTGTSNNTIKGNYIGVDATGTTALGNSDDGVWIGTGAMSNTIGGTATGAGNVISGNTDIGIVITGTGTSSNLVQGNYIGTNAAGTGTIANNDDGVWIGSGASSNTIGGTSSSARNIISGNTQDGVEITGSGSDSNVVQGNYIGIDVTGTSDLGNGDDGITINSDASSNTIGGTATGARNIISGNTSLGIQLDGSSTTGNTVAGNYIGTNAAGTAALGNTGAGIRIDNGASSNTVGGTMTNARNVISGNSGDGIYITDSGTDSNTIQGNYIGTNATGTSAIANTDRGIQVESSASNTQIGGTASGAGNVISGNSDDGIHLSGSSTNTTIEGNYIGTNASGTAAIANSGDGIDIRATTAGTTIGGTTSGARNIISGNSLHGIYVLSDSTTIQGNYIGVGADGTTAIGNTFAGISIQGNVANNVIGGTASGAGNTIAYNSQDGIELDSLAGTGNSILGNSIHSNTGNGIDIDNDGITANDAGDSDTGANDLQNFPVLTAADIESGSEVTITGSLNSTASTDFRIEFFRNTVATGQDGSGYGEGEDYLGYVDVTTDGSGNASINTTLSAAVLAGEFITATATVSLGGGNYGNTSEFGLNVVAATDNDVPVITNLSGDTLAYTEGDGAQVIEQSANAAVSDVDSSNFDTGTLTVSFTAGSDSAEDVLSIRNEGSGAGEISLSGYGIGYGGTLIGSFTGGANGDPLVITLNNNANAASVAALIQNITYENSDTTNPTTSSRTVRYVLTDGDGGTSANYDTTVTISTTNDSPTFDLGEGSVTTSIGTGDDGANGVVIQPDGKILVSGETFDGSTYQFGLIRYNVDGSLDTSFGTTGGKVTTSLTAGSDKGERLTLQADGKILVAGFAGSDMGLVRYNVDGSLDTTFGGGDGIVITDFGGTDNGYAVAVQIDGKILVSGKSDADFAVARYNADGTLDTTFDTDGKVITSLTGVGTDNSYTLVIQADGKILVAGQANADYAIVRYNTDGSLDTSFGGGDGMVTTDLSLGANEQGFALAIQSDGKVLLSGFGSDIGLVRYNSDGTLDTSFGGGDGIVTASIQSSLIDVGTVLLQTDGKIVVAGSGSYGGTDSFGVLRFNADGTVDTSFGTGGKVTTSLSAGLEAGWDASLQPDGKIVVVGSSHNGSNNDVAILRYHTDGGLDTTFGLQTTLDGTPTFTEGGAAVILDANVNVNDSELNALNSGNGNYAGASITLVRNGGVSTDDVFSFTDGNSISLSGSNLIKNSQTIATFDLTTTPGQLVVTFTDANGEIPTSADIDNILRQLTYANSSDTPPASAQIDWSFNDGNTGSQGSGGALLATGNMTVNITAVEDVPVITNLSGDTLAYTEGDGAAVIEQSANAAVTDVDSSNFDTGTLTVSFTAGSDSAEDVLSIRNQGTGAGQIGVSGSTVTYAGTTIGTFTGGTSGTDLVITLNTNADATATGALIQNITYENTDTDNPTTGSRTVRYVLTDGDGGTSANYDTTITFTATNDAPVNSMPSNEFTALDTAVVFSTANSNLISVSDADATSSDLEVTLSVTNGTLTLAGTTGLSFTVGDGTSDTTMTFTGTVSAINTAIDGLSFTPTTSFRGLAQLTLATDDQGNTGSGGAQIDTDTVDIHVGAIVVTNTTDTSNGTVTTKDALVANDGGDGISLREAIEVANAEAGTDYIYFQISDALVGGAHTIAVGSGGLDSITETVILDGTTDSDFSTTPIIELDGSSAGAVDGLTLAAGSDGSTIRGLVINRFGGDGIEINNSDSNTIEGNFIGTDVTGTVDLGNTVDGLAIVNTSNNNTIGGTTAAARNIISGNDDEGIHLSNSDSNTILGNYIGTDVTGTVDLGNSDNGIQVESGSDTNTIGGTSVGARNIISGNNDKGIEIDGSSSNIVQGNYIGTDVTGTAALGNSSGLRIDSGASNNLIGGTAAGEGNIIAHGTGGNGIRLSSAGAGNAILGNAIYSNNNLAIDMDSSGITANDVGDGDTGSNNLQNFPVLTSATSTGTQVTIEGTFNSTAFTTYRLEFFASTTADGSGYGEAERFLGSASITTDGSGNAIINETITASVTAGEFVTATATVDLGGGSYGDTSEFALNVTAGGNTAPVITSDGGGATATVNAAEDQTTVTTITATDAQSDPLTYSIVGGADSSHFTINSSSGVLAFATAPDFEAPTDADVDNIYEVQVQVSDGNGGIDIQTLNVTVTNVVEAPPPMPEPPPSPEPEPEPEPAPEPEGEETPETTTTVSQPSPSPQGPVTPSLLPNNPRAQDGRSDTSEGTSVLGHDLHDPFGDLSASHLRDLTSATVLGLSDSLSGPMRTFDLGKSASAVPIELGHQLDALAEHLQETIHQDQTHSEIVSGVTTGAGVTLSAGYVAWMLRGTSLLTSLFASLPAWGNFDPLPILGGGYTARKTSEQKNEAEKSQENKEHQGLDEIFRDSDQE